MLDEPFGRQMSRSGFPATRSLFDDPFFNAPMQARPAVDVSEDGNKYIVEAELPGVKKEDVDVRIGDGGRSVTIEGKILRRGGGDAPSTSQTDASISSAPTESAADASSSGKPSSALSGHAKTSFADALSSLDASSKAVATQDQSSNQLSVERAFTGSSTFTRTVYLPRPVDPKSVSAKLADGILTLSIPKAEEVGSVKVNID